MTIDSTDNVYVVGLTDGFGTSLQDGLIVKYDNLDIEKWYTLWSGSSIELCDAVVVDSWDNVYIAGNTYSYGAGSADAFLVRYALDSDNVVGLFK